MRVGMIGLGKLGLPVALAIEAAGHEVMGYDTNREIVKFVAAGGPMPYQEEGAQALLNNNGILLGSPSQIAEWADLIFVAVQTPHQPEYEGVTRLPETRADFDYTHLREAINSVVGDDQPIVVISTVLPGTIERITRDLYVPNDRVLYNPFFIAMGTTIPDFRNPEFVLVGTDGAHPGPLKEFYATIHDRPVFVTTIKTAELTKVAYNCYSDDTEVMTSQGWKLFADLSGSEQILSLNPETHLAQWSSHRPVPGQEGHSEMIRFSSKKDDILVTPEHNMFAATLRHEGGSLPCDGEDYRYEFNLISAGELAQRKSFTFTRSTRWLGNPQETVTIASRRLQTDLYARFMGWYLAEGCVSQISSQSWQIVVSQSKRANPGKWEECGEVVARICQIFDIGFSESEAGFTFYDKQLGMFLSTFGHAGSKWVPEIIKDSEPEVIREFLDTYLAADGCDGREFGNLRYYATTSDRMASDLGEMIVKVGHMPSYRTTTSPLSGRPCHLVYETTSKTSNPSKVERVPYEGKVYCTRLEKNHIMLTRRNGKCTWQGNTFIGLKIAFANTMMELCEKTGADVDDLVDALSLADRRLLSPAYLRGGMGDGGGCHPRDNIALSYLARHLGLSYDLFEALMICRERQTEWLAHLIEDEQMSEFHYDGETGDVVTRNIEIMGKAYKPETNLTVGSPATLLSNILDEMGVMHEHTDPVVDA